MGNIIDIHIQRTLAGKHFPFDKVYLAQKEDAHLLSKIFGYCIVLPMSLPIRNILRRTLPKQITQKGFRRNDAGKNIPLDLDKKDGEQWWKEFEQAHKFSERLVVVPVLTSSRRKRERPRYLGARYWESVVKRNQQRHGVKLPQYFDESAYLATPHEAPNDKIAPVCVICPRMLRQMQGECNPGDEICYKALDFSRITEMEDAGLQPDDDIDYRAP